MIYSGKALSVDVLPSGIANLVFDLEGSSVNKFNEDTLRELRQAVTARRQIAAALIGQDVVSRHHTARPA